jgi:hypothetical protein
VKYVHVTKAATSNHINDCCILGFKAILAMFRKDLLPPSSWQKKLIIFTAMRTSNIKVILNRDVTLRNGRIVHGELESIWKETVVA